MTPRRRVLLAGIFHETHTFVPGLTRTTDFRIRRGDELLLAQDDGSTLAGAVYTGRKQGWELLPAVHITATPSAIVADAVIEHFWDELYATITSVSDNPIDGIYLDLHGAMVSQSFPDVEGEILGRIRSLPPLAKVPIGGVLDLHGNISPKMAALSTCMVAYRENPHTDAYAAACQGARLLDIVMGLGRSVVTAHAQAPLLLPPLGTATAEAPMATLRVAAQELEQSDPNLLAVNVFAGFPYADVPDAGVSFTAVTMGDPRTAQAALAELVTLARTLRHHADPQGITLEEALAYTAVYREGPVLLIEPADNIGGGAPGDLTVVLRGLLAAGVQGAGVIIADPQAVACLQDWDVGQRGPLEIGGRSGVSGADPVVLEVTLRSRSDGCFTLEDRHSHLAMSGIAVEMGPCAVVSGQGVTILLTSLKTPPFDLGQWRSQGLDPASFRVIAVKAAVAHRQAYDPIARASFTLNTPGPCTADLRTLNYRQVRRPIYPLEDH